MTYEITIRGDGSKEDIIIHLQQLIKKLQSRDVKKSLTSQTYTENGKIETMIDRHSFLTF